MSNIPQNNCEKIEKKSARILVVDDDKISRTIIKQIIQKLGVFFDLYIEEAVDWFEWKDKINSGNYDVVFMDYHMPKMSGIEAIKSITIENKPNIIMVTAMDPKQEWWNDIIQAAYENQVYNYLVKPVNSFAVTQIGKNAIQDAIHKRELQETLWEVSHTKKRIDDILEGFLSHEKSYIHSINHKKFPMFDISVFQKPYERWSGDIFLHNKYRERHILSFSLFDVSWHSLETAVDAQHIKFLRMWEMGHPILWRPYTLSELVYIMNDKIKNAFSHYEHKKTYSTFAEVRLNMESNLLEVVNCWCEPPILIRNNGEVIKFKSKTLPLGMLSSKDFSGMFWDYMYQTTFQRWDWLFMTSDGFVEVEDEKWIRFMDIVPHIIKKYKDLSASAVQKKLLDYYALHVWKLEFWDDITFAVMKVRGDYKRTFMSYTKESEKIFWYFDFMDQYLWELWKKKISDIKLFLKDMIYDIFIHTHYTFDGISLEYNLLEDKKIFEIILMNNMQTEIKPDFLSPYWEHFHQLISHLIENTDKCFIMEQGKKIVIHFTY